MKKILIIVGLLFGIFSIGCHEVTVGYLDTSNAGYDPDSMVVRKVLELDSTLNERYESDWETCEDFYEILGYNTVQECFDDMFGYSKYDYNEDYYRWRLSIPWLSTKIQGVKGTQPMQIRLKSVVSEDGDAALLQEVLSVRGDGQLSVPTDVSAIPNGHYIISLQVYNEGYCRDMDNVFTIVIKDK